MSDGVSLLFFFNENADAGKFLSDLQESAVKERHELDFDVNGSFATVTTTPEACRQLFGWELEQVERNVPRRAPNPSIDQGTYLAWQGKTPVPLEWQDIIDSVSINGSTFSL